MKLNETDKDCKVYIRLDSQNYYLNLIPAEHIWGHKEKYDYDVTVGSIGVGVKCVFLEGSWDGIL